MFFAFIAAEVTNIVSSVKIAYTENVDKIQTYEKWMENMKLPHEIKERVRAFHELKWKKFKGLDENQILSDLPKTLREKISVFLLKNMIQSSDIFASFLDKGFMMSFIKRLKFQIINAQEYVFRKGDIAEELYFIVEGEVVVYDLDEMTIIVTLKKNSVFGEMGVIDLKAGTRSRSIKTVTDVSLAVMSLDDFREICNEYPAVYRAIHNKVQERTMQNKERERKNKELDPVRASANSERRSEIESPRLLMKEGSGYEDSDVSTLRMQREFSSESAGLQLQKRKSGFLLEKTVQEQDIPRFTTFAKEDDLNTSRRMEGQNSDRDGMSSKRIEGPNSFRDADTSMDPLVQLERMFKDNQAMTNRPLDNSENQSAVADSNRGFTFNNFEDGNSQQDIPHPRRGKMVAAIDIQEESEYNRGTKKKSSLFARQLQIDTKLDKFSESGPDRPGLNKVICKSSDTEKASSSRNSILYDEGENNKIISALRRQLETINMVLNRLGNQKIYRKFSNIFQKIRDALMNVIVLYNFIFLTIHISFKKKSFTGGYYAMEIISISIFATDGLTKLLDACAERVK
jgi:cAMP-binding proteins - catabolite gene activator and regulatory subunit of cAMP-dependent protein kinases